MSKYDSDYHDKIDSTDQTISYDEARRRMPTIQLIENEDIRFDVQRLTSFAPEYFWIRPGSYSEYHNGFRHGLWLHTLKLSTVIDRLFDSYANRYELEPLHRDYAHAAAILHDQWKNGPHPESDRTNYKGNHATVAADVVRNYSDLPDVVADAIEQHMGPWGDVPLDSPVARLVHNADMVASDDAINIGVYEYLPAELEGIAHKQIERPETTNE